MPSRKRRRAHGDQKTSHPQKRQKHAAAPASPVRPAIKHAVLDLYYRHVWTLRAYLLSRLPASSRLRRKKLASIGLSPDPSPVEQLLSRLLDNALVAYVDDGAKDKNGEQSQAADRQHQRAAYTEKKLADESRVTLSDAAEGTSSPQSEIVDFVIWLLFKRAKQNGKTSRDGAKWASDFPAHVLCHGFQRGQPRPGGLAVATSTIAGIYAARPCQNAQALKELPWPQLLALLGASGERIMIDLLMDCSIFLPVEAGRGNLIQVTGKPLCNLALLSLDKSSQQAAASRAAGRSLGELSLIRNRMFYAKPSITAAGAVHFGLKHIHVLNRFPYLHHPAKQDPSSDLATVNKTGTAHVMMYIFPRQFGLHNVFTSTVDRTQTVQKLQDYVLREDEIQKKFGSAASAAIPKRLRGLPFHLTEKFRVLHSRCSYYELLQHYCPVSSCESQNDTGSESPARTDLQALEAAKPVTDQHDVQSPDKQATILTKPAPQSANARSLVQQATPLPRVSAFCQAVLKNVVPNDFWGSGDVQVHNKRNLMKKVDLFIQIRRFETINLHDLMQGFKIADIEWLAPPGLKAGKLSQTDLQKRREIFAELLYYLFDSFLVPLIRTNFYVTESNVHRNKLFYFRHDVWKRVSEPALTDLKARMYEEVKQSEAVRILGSRDLSYGQMRLLPKQTSMRPIMNLRRRAAKKGSAELAPSINTLLTPVQAMLNLEMKQHPERLGASMFSMRSLYTKLKEFKKHISETGRRPFYFAKVDVKSAFDTISQGAVVELVNSLPSHAAYHIDKYVEMQPPDKVGQRPGGGSIAPKRRWRTMAKADRDRTGFHDTVESEFGRRSRHTIFVDGTFRRTRDTADVAGLVASHILQNLVKIGKKFYRQKDGIPQGSVLSSLLCNYFYADLEAKELGFLSSDNGDCLLLRLIDDFLLITSDRSKAARFVAVMHAGHPRYGVAVNPEKSLVNFDLSIDGTAIARVPDGAVFPYCGTFIHCLTLDITKDRSTKSQVVFDTLTVEYSRSPGYQFKRKVLSFFKRQSHFMFFDTSHNSVHTMLRNLRSAFVETATKMWAYVRCLPKDKQPGGRLVISTIRELAELAFAILNRRSRALRRPDYEFAASKSQLTWLLLHAFSSVLQSKQARHASVLAWLRGEMKQLQGRKDMRLPKEFT